MPKVAEMVLFIGPGAGLSGGFYEGTLRFHLSELSAQLAGEAADEVGTLGGKVVLFADVAADIIEFSPTGLVVVDEFPITLADSTVVVNPRTSIAPHMRVVPN